MFNFFKIPQSDDFLFLKFFSKIDSINNLIVKCADKGNNDEISKIYQFNVEYKNMKLKPIKLVETINKNENFYEKIAPGTKGKFTILLDSKQKLKYQVVFKSINEKPKNLKFEAVKNGKNLLRSDSLEELSNELSGNITKNGKINIDINWYWNYEDEDTNKASQYDIDVCDTEDAKNVKQYKFDVCVIGESL